MKCRAEKYLQEEIRQLTILHSHIAITSTPILSFQIVCSDMVYCIFRLLLRLDSCNKG